MRICINNIEINLEKIRRDALSWLKVSLNRFEFGASLNTVMKFL